MAKVGQDRRSIPSAHLRSNLPKITKICLKQVAQCCVLCKISPMDIHHTAGGVLGHPSDLWVALPPVV
jgi:hypothetical protein